MKPLIEEISKLINSNELAFGDKVQEFEQKFKTFSKYEYNIGYNSASSAAYAIFAYLYQEYGQCNIYTPTIGFASPAWAAWKNRHRVIFTDVDDNLLMDIPENLLPNVETGMVNIMNKSILMPVLYGGISVSSSIDDLIFDNGSKIFSIVTDSAHCVNSNLAMSNMSEFSFFSFHPNKPVCMSQGGIIGTNIFEAADFFLKFRNFGRQNLKSSESYEITQTGGKFYMTNLDATIGLNSLNRYYDNLVTRRANHIVYCNRLSKYGRFLDHDEDSSYHLCTLILEKPVAPTIRNKLSLPIHYPLLHKTTFWKDENGPTSLPNAERLEKHIVNLPIHHSVELRSIYQLIKDMKGLLSLS